MVEAQVRAGCGATTAASSSSARAMAPSTSAPTDSGVTVV